MSNFLSNRQRELKIGIVSYTENNTVLEVTGNINASGIITATGGFNLGISSAGTSITSGPVTRLDFAGLGISSVTMSGSTAVINVPGTTKTVNAYIATEGQTNFNSTYSIGYVDVYLNGVKLSQSQYTATNGTSVILVDGASLDDVVEIIGFKTNITTTSTSTLGIATAGGSVGTGFTLLDFRGSSISTVTVSSGIATINIEGGGSSTPEISPVMMSMIF